MTGRLDIDALRVFRAVASHGGVTRAADHVSLSQSAVSHKIKRLEDNIGCGLLTRRPGAPLLTEAGSRLLGYAERILSLHDEALESLSRRSLAGRIRLGMTEDMSSGRLARILGRFTRLFPDVSVRTQVSQSLVLQSELESGQVDVAVMQVFSRDIRATDTVLSKDRLCWVKAADFQLDADRPIPFLSYDDHCFYKDWVLENAERQGHRFKIVLECASNAGIVAAVEAGLGVSIVNRRHVTSAMEMIKADFVVPPDIGYVVRLSSRTNPAVKALADEIGREVAEIAPLGRV